MRIRTASTFLGFPEGSESICLVYNTGDSGFESVVIILYCSLSVLAQNHEKHLGKLWFP